MTNRNPWTQSPDKTSMSKRDAAAAVDAFQTVEGALRAGDPTAFTGSRASSTSPIAPLARVSIRGTRPRKSTSLRRTCRSLGRQPAEEGCQRASFGLLHRTKGASGPLSSPLQDELTFVDDVADELLLRCRGQAELVEARTRPGGRWTRRTRALRADLGAGGHRTAAARRRSSPANARLAWRGAALV